MANTYFEYKKSDKNYDCIISLSALGIGTIGISIKQNGLQAGMTLNEKEQDELIAGILERRTSISSTGSEKSKIHPPIN